MSGIALGISGLALSAGGMGMSLGQAASARKKKYDARQKAKILRGKAAAKAEKDFYEGLNVPLDAFGEQYRQQLQSQQQGVQALQEGDSRNLLGGLGALQGATNQAQETTRIGMQEALYDNDKMKADAKQAINQQLIDIDLGAAKDMAAMEQAYGQQESQGIQGALQAAGGMLSAANDLAPLYGKSGSGAAAGKIYDDALGSNKDFKFQRKQLNTNYDPSKANDPAYKESKFIMQGGKPLMQDLTRAEALQSIQSQGFSGKNARQLKRGKYDFGGGSLGGYADPRFAQLFYE